MSRRRTVTARRTTTVTEELIAEDETLTDIPPLALAPGWEPALAALGGGPSLRAQRAGQVERCLDFLTLWAVSSPPGSRVPERLVPDAVIILRAGPNATPLELTMGRSI